MSRAGHARRTFVGLVSGGVCGVSTVSAGVFSVFSVFSGLLSTSPARAVCRVAVDAPRLTPSRAQPDVQLAAALTAVSAVQRSFR